MLGDQTYIISDIVMSMSNAIRGRFISPHTIQYNYTQFAQLSAKVVINNTFSYPKLSSMNDIEPQKNFQKE